MVFVDVETTFRHTFPSSDLHCLPPDDPIVLCANTGIRLLANHSLAFIFSPDVIKIRKARVVLIQAHAHVTPYIACEKAIGNQSSFSDYL